MFTAKYHTYVKQKSITNCLHSYLGRVIKAKLDRAQSTVMKNWFSKNWDGVLSAYFIALRFMFCNHFYTKTLFKKNSNPIFL